MRLALAGIIGWPERTAFDLARVDALEVGRRRAEVGMTQLALDDVHGHGLPCQLDRVCMTQLMRREPATDSDLNSKPA